MFFYDFFFTSWTNGKLWSICLKLDTRIHMQVLKLTAWYSETLHAQKWNDEMLFKRHSLNLMGIELVPKWTADVEQRRTWSLVQVWGSFLKFLVASYYVFQGFSLKHLKMQVRTFSSTEYKLKALFEKWVSPRKGHLGSSCWTKEKIHCL